MTPSQQKRRPKKTPRRPKRDRYDANSYRRAVVRAIAKGNRVAKEQDKGEAKIHHWHPYQLRHSYATQIRNLFGVEAAQIGLGHSRTNMVDVYAEKNADLAVNIARKIG